MAGSKSMGEHALEYARNGYNVFPLHTVREGYCSCNPADECKKGKPGKHPRIKEWPTVVCDPATVGTWWQKWPDANIGLRLDGLLVLDIDTHEANKNGPKTLTGLKDKHGELRATAAQDTAGGGFHTLWVYHGAPLKCEGFAPGLDLFAGAGSYIVAAPSMDGRYRWKDDHPSHPGSTPYNELPPALPPEWLLRVATTKHTTRKGKGIPIEQLLKEALDKVEAGEGEGRNDTGMWLFMDIRDEGYSKEEASAVLSEWVARANELTAGEHPYTIEEAKATLDSIYNRPPREPRTQGKTDILLKMTEDFEYFKSGPANDAYVRMLVGNHRETVAANPKVPRMREILTHRYFEKYGKAPTRNALNEAVDTIAARCSAGPKVDVHVRFARAREAMYLDLCDDDWRAMQITAHGWQVVENPPVLFRRASGAKALPVPVSGGSLAPLRQLLNVDDIGEDKLDAQWILMLSWLTGAFLPDGAFSHLVLEGEQGSAKSTTARLLLSMLDPSDAGLSAPPKNEEDATISALNAGLLAYDNLSGCRAEISDVLCRFSTGQGFKTRTLYTNTDLTVVTVKIPVLLNGIEATVMRPDLLERSIKLRLPFIPAKKRQTEVDIWRAFSAVHPSCLGALLDAVSCGLRYLDTTRISDSPRMADFCRWVVACEASLPWAPGDFMKVYSAMQNDAASSLAENDSLASALVEWAEPIKPGTGYAITARNLLLALNSLVQDYPKDVRHWPSSPEALAHRLPRLAPTLRAHGVEVTRLQRTANGRPWEFWRGQRQLSLHLAQSKVDEAIEADGEPIAA